MFLDIGEVAAKTGMRPSTLRYYEEIGLISSVARHGLRRQFPPEVLLQIKLIAMGKSAGFSLQELAAMFGKTGLRELPRAAMNDKADQIDRQISELTVLSNTLRHVARCPAPSHLQCPSFRRLLDEAGKRQMLHRKVPGSTGRRGSA